MLIRLLRKLKQASNNQEKLWATKSPEKKTAPPPEWVVALRKNTVPDLEIPDVHDQRDDHGTDDGTQAHADSEHQVSLEVTLKGEGHLNQKVQDEHLKGKPPNVPSRNNLDQLGNHSPHIDQARQPNNKRPANQPSNIFSFHRSASSGFLRFSILT